MPNKLFKEANADEYIKLLEKDEVNNSYEAFERYVDAFVEANRTRLDYLIDESHTFIKKTAAKFSEENIVLSFSGGKDSTVTADLAIKALSDPSLVHIFGNTTLEFPLTIEYAKRYRNNHPQSIFKTAENREQVFKDVCEDIGPPARMMRWCCSMFKTGPITRVINSLYRDQRILTFYGIRKSESVSRSKYNRVEDDAESVKIQQQTVASPIFFWKDMDIWLYILAEKIDFNDAYRLGYALLFALTGCMSRLNRTNKWLPSLNMAPGPITGMLYIPSLYPELNVFNGFRNKVRDIEKFYSASQFMKEDVIVSTQSSDALNNIPSDVIDYIFIDPPFGDNIMYSESNFLWETWLKVYTNPTNEAIINSTQKKTLVEYQSLIEKCFEEFYRILKPKQAMIRKRRHPAVPLS